LYCAFISVSSFHHTAHTETSPLSLHDALPISIRSLNDQMQRVFDALHALDHHQRADFKQVRGLGVCLSGFLRPHANAGDQFLFADRKSTRLNSSHEWISYAVFCLKKKRSYNIL